MFITADFSDKKDDKHNIVWGVVESNRVGPTTSGIAAGIQDIIAIKDMQSLCLEVGKPFPDLECDALKKYAGVLFREQAYQDIVTCMLEQRYTLFIEHPFKTAMHETKEEHGLDLDVAQGRDHHLLKALIQLPLRKLSGKQGAKEQCFWLASLNGIDTVTLQDTKKIEKKIKRNFNRPFYERGCWKILDELKLSLQEQRNTFIKQFRACDLVKMSTLPENTSQFQQNTVILVGTGLHYVHVKDKTITEVQKTEWNTANYERTLRHLAASCTDELLPASHQNLGRITALTGQEHSSSTLDEIDLITGVLETFEETILFLEQTELLIRAEMGLAVGKGEVVQEKPTKASVVDCRERLFSHPATLNDTHREEPPSPLLCDTGVSLS